MTELVVIFADKNFKTTFAKEWSLEALQAKASMPSKALKMVWEQDKTTALSTLIKGFPKNWKKISDFDKAYKKWWFGQQKKNQERVKNGKPQMAYKEFQKGMPRFLTTLKPQDIKVVFAAKDCRVWLKNFEEADFKNFERIIKLYNRLTNNYKNKKDVS
jgi:hypothetical protein